MRMWDPGNSYACHAACNLSQRVTPKAIEGPNENEKRAANEAAPGETKCVVMLRLR
jgi:hypothetical protein